MENIRETCRLQQYTQRCFILIIIMGVLEILLLHNSSKVDNWKHLQYVRFGSSINTTLSTAPHSRTRPAFYPSNGTGRSMDIFFNTKSSRSKQISLCKGINISLILPVYSAPSNFDRRKAIRQTYGKSCKALKQGCQLFFIIGVSLNHSLNEKVLFEYESEEDILFIDKVDTYRDLNNKAAAMLDWVDTFCSSASYVLHVIDDVYPNIQLFMNVLGSIQRKDFILGYVVPSSPPQRSGKFTVTYDEYPYDKFPAYVSGTAYAFPMSTVRRLKAAMFSAMYYWIEDVWINGMVREKAGVEAVSLNTSFHDYPDLKATFSDIAYYHHVNVEDFYGLYNNEKNNHTLQTVQ